MSYKENSSKAGYLLLFIFLFITGACFVSFNNALSVIAIIMGTALALYGIILAFLAISAKGRGASYAFKLIIGAIAIICGVVTAVFREGAIEIIASLISLFLIIDGSFKLHTAAMSKRYKTSSWWLILSLSVVIIAGAFITLKIIPGNMSEDSGSAVPILLGIIMMIDGVANLFSIFYISRYESGLVKEITEQIVEEEKSNLEHEKELCGYKITLVDLDFENEKAIKLVKNILKNSGKSEEALNALPATLVDNISHKRADKIAKALQKHSIKFEVE